MRINRPPFPGSFTSSGANETHTITLAWGDGSPNTVLNLAAGVWAFSAPHQYLDNLPSNAPYTISVTVSDTTGGASASGSIAITVLNVAPAPTILGVPSGNTSPEETTISLTGQANDPGTLDNDTLAWQVSSSNGQMIAPGAGAGFAFKPNAPGMYTVTLTATDHDGAVGAVTQTITVTPVSFRVINFSSNPSGFDVQFIRPPNTTVLNLYSGSGTAAPDLTLTGPSGSVRGSLIWNAATNTASFVATGGILAAGSYSVDLASRADGWVDTGGNLLDGNADGTPGDDYLNTFVVAAPLRRRQPAGLCQRARAERECTRHRVQRTARQYQRWDWDYLAKPPGNLQSFASYNRSVPGGAGERSSQRVDVNHRRVVSRRPVDFGRRIGFANWRPYGVQYCRVYSLGRHLRRMCRLTDCESPVERRRGAGRSG